MNIQIFGKKCNDTRKVIDACISAGCGERSVPYRGKSFISIIAE